MPVTPEDVRRVAELASLHLAPEQEAGLVHRFEQIIRYVDQLQEVDTRGVEPLAHPFAESSTPLRPDVARDGLPLDEVLANAPERYGPYFQVPRMIEETPDA
ncbi:MAG TPA: Asp-tRNA(Asn)/Glu-tRNA(Gln) amidotransferase subunit GatC [Bacillota bacterium]